MRGDDFRDLSPPDAPPAAQTGQIRRSRLTPHPAILSEASCLVQKFEGLLQRPRSEFDLDRALGLAVDDGQILETDLEFDEAGSEDTAEEI